MSEQSKQSEQSKGQRRWRKKHPRRAPRKATIVLNKLDYVIEICKQLVKIKVGPLFLLKLRLVNTTFRDVVEHLLPKRVWWHTRRYVSNNLHNDYSKHTYYYDLDGVHSYYNGVHLCPNKDLKIKSKSQLYKQSWLSFIYFSRLLQGERILNAPSSIMCNIKRWKYWIRRNKNKMGDSEKKVKKPRTLNPIRSRYRISYWNTQAGQRHSKKCNADRKLKLANNLSISN